MRHEDVHGVSGTGDHIADVFEASDGTCVVRWLGKDGSTNVYAGVKNVTNVHGHGGKTEIQWLWEQEPDVDPMEAVFSKKLEDAGVPAQEGEEDVESIAAEIVEEVASKIVEKVAEKTAKAKVSENAADK